MKKTCLLIFAAALLSACAGGFKILSPEEVLPSALLHNPDAKRFEAEAECKVHICAIIPEDKKPKMKVDLQFIPVENGKHCANVPASSDEIKYLCFPAQHVDMLVVQFYALEDLNMARRKSYVKTCATDLCNIRTHGRGICRYYRTEDIADIACSP